jgi:hypothetical protein
MYQPPPIAVGPACMLVGVEGAQAAGTGNRADIDRDMAPTWARRHGKQSGASPSMRPDVQALA